MSAAPRSGDRARPATRRGFLKLLTAALGGLIGAVLAVPAFRFLAFPARKKVVIGPDSLVPVGQADVVGDRPVRVEIIAPEQRDAWAKVDNVRLGAAWLVRAGTDIRAFSTTCPHLGCAIDYDAKSESFRCPCHKSAFDTDGNRVSGPAKRGMDPLDIKVEDGRVLVRFKRFKLDVPDREDA